MGVRLPTLAIIVAVAQFAALPAPVASSDEIEYQHGYAFLADPALPADYDHFAYVNPDAPKGGTLRITDMGNWDNFNNVTVRGRLPLGVWFWDSQRNYVQDSLMYGALDEPATQYGLIAEGIAVGENYAWVAFKLREEARWHDGKPITPEDVVFSFDVYRNHATPTISTPMQVVESVEVIGPREVKFHIAPAAQGNPVVPRRLGVAPIIPRHYWQDRDISKTTVDAPLTSGPYRVKRYEVGRWIEYERVPDYWARDLPVRKGMWNYDIIKVDYFRDDMVQTEAVKGHLIDIHVESVSRRWVTAYEFPAADAGLLKKDIFNFIRPAGIWWPIFWNLDQPRFQDIRVREALDLARPGSEWGSMRSYGFWGQGVSFFNDSPYAATGLPNEGELALLEPLRDQIPERVFTHEFTRPPNQHKGWDRGNLLRAAELLRQAGWVMEDGKLVHGETGEPFHIRMVAVSPALGRAWISYSRLLERLGITTSIKSPEVSNWLYRMRSGDFDAGAVPFITDNTPTMNITNFFHSSTADQAYSQNWGNLRDPAVDTLIGHVYAAQTYEEFTNALRALDRVLIWNFYWQPGTSRVDYNVVYWDKFGRPEVEGRLLRLAHIDTWWWDEAKAARVAEFTQAK